MQRTASALSFIETCYSRTLDEAAWLAALTGHLPVISRDAIGVAVYPYAITHEGKVDVTRIAIDPRGLERTIDGKPPRGFIDYLNVAPDGPALAVQTFGQPRPRAATPSEVSPRMPAAVAHSLPPGCDSIALLATLDGVSGVTFATLEPRRTPKLSERRRPRLTRLSAHLAAGHRLRQLTRVSPADSVAVLSPDGRLLHAEPEARAGERQRTLIDAVKHMDRARCQRAKRSPEEALELWHALLDGRYTLVEHIERDGRRLVLAVHVRSEPLGLSPRELAVVAAAADGLGNRAIAARLGIGAATAGSHLYNACRKLGTPDRRALILWYRRFVALGRSER